jgi:hypothetical protein
VAHWYDTKVPEPGGPSSPTPFGLTGIMAQLKNWQPPPAT